MNDRLAERSKRWIFLDERAKEFKHNKIFKFGKNPETLQNNNDYVNEDSDDNNRDFETKHEDCNGKAGSSVKCDRLVGFVVDELHFCHASRHKMVRAGVVSHGKL